MARFILFDVRLPRLLAGLLAGAAFGLSGALIQQLSGNDLASPDLIGLNVGASLGAVLSITLFGTSGLLTGFGALAGIFVTFLVISALAYQRPFDPRRFILIGLGLGASLVALVEFLLIHANIMQAEMAYRWMIGSVSTPATVELWVGAFVLTPLLIASFWMSEGLRNLSLGPTLATTLGTHVTRLRLGGIVISLMASATAVFIAGPVAFVAFVAGPLTRAMVGGPYHLVQACLTGSLLLVGADLTARLVIAPTQLPVGLFTALIGGPFLIWLLIRKATS